MVGGFLDEPWLFHYESLSRPRTSMIMNQYYCIKVGFHQSFITTKQQVFFWRIRRNTVDKDHVVLLNNCKTSPFVRQLTDVRWNMPEPCFGAEVPFICHRNLGPGLRQGSWSLCLPILSAPCLLSLRLTFQRFADRSIWAADGCGHIC